MDATESDNAIHPEISYDSEQGQRLLLVMTALHELGSENPKQNTIAYIFDNGWYVAAKGDGKKYESTGEARIKNWFAWARKHAAIRDWILNNQRDAWALSIDGRRILESSRKKFQLGKWDVRKCDLWSSRFKKNMDPNYICSEKDKPRRPGSKPRGQKNKIDSSLLEGI